MIDVSVLAPTGIPSGQMSGVDIPDLFDLDIHILTASLATAHHGPHRVPSPPGGGGGEGQWTDAWNCTSTCISCNMSCQLGDNCPWGPEHGPQPPPHMTPGCPPNPIPEW